MYSVPLSEQQSLFLVESSQLYEAWIAAYRHAQSYRYGMRWVKSKGQEYLVRLHDAKGNGKSQGPRSVKTEEIYAAFNEGKLRAEERLRGLSQRMQQQAALNRAAKIGRLPTVIGEILLALAAAELGKDFCVVGTHAIFAYEAMAGVQCRMELLASGDVDLLVDPRRQVSLVSEKLEGRGLLGLLKRVDKSFEPMPDEAFRAVNKNGFMVDLLIPQRDMREADKITYADQDMIANEVPNLHWLINAPKDQVVAISANGSPVNLQVPDPRAFALHKAWLSERPDRNPAKKIRDRQQAAMVCELVQEHLPNKPFKSEDLRFLSAKMVLDATRTIEETSGIRLPGMGI